MNITLTSPTDGHRTDLEIQHDVTIRDAYYGPIFQTVDGACLAVCMRDDGYELACWRGAADHDAALPADAIQCSISPAGVRWEVDAAEPEAVGGLDASAVVVNAALDFVDHGDPRSLVSLVAAIDAYWDDLTRAYGS